MIVEILILGAILVVQPLIALLWAYLALRALMWYGFSRSGSWVDERVSHFSDEIKGGVDP